MSLKMKGAMTRCRQDQLPRADLLDHSDELVADRAHGVLGSPPEVPQVRSHTQASTTLTIASVGCSMTGSGWSPTSTPWALGILLHAWLVLSIGGVAGPYVQEPFESCPTRRGSPAL